MLTREDNETLTSIGPGTIMGNLMRQYWLPALQSQELPVPDCAPVRVLLLGERLVALRDSKGHVGLLCEQCGLRDRIRARAYPCVERKGIIWAYMGPRAALPPLPELAMNMGPPPEGRVDLTLVECNWLRSLEGDVDLDHILVWHGAVEVVDSLAGCTFACNITAGASRRSPPTGPGALRLWAVGQFMFPFYSMLPCGALGEHWVAARVPMDDHHTMTFGMHAARARARGARGTFAVRTGRQNQGAQDSSITRSRGAIVDRTQEHLCAGEAAIAQIRRRLLNAALQLEEHGITPPGVDLPSAYRMKQGVLRVRSNRSWREELELSRLHGAELSR